MLHNQVFAITQDNKGYIWLATRNGLQRYDGTRFTYYPDIMSNPAEAVTFGAEMYCDKKTNSIYVLKNEVVERFEPGKNRFFLQDASQALNDTLHDSKIFMTDAGQKWLLTKNNIYLFMLSLVNLINT